MKLGKDMDEFHKIVGSMLRDVRTVRNIARNDVGMVAGLHGTAIRRIEVGDQHIRLFDFLNLCRIYEIDADELLGEFMKDAPKPKPLTIEIGGKTYSLMEVPDET